MIYRKLCRHLVLVSEIGLGTAQLSNTDGNYWGVKYVPPQIGRNILSLAIERGINFFDTGDQYGNAEVLLGELPSDTKRKLIIATKAGLRSDGVRDFSETYLRQQVDRSLKRLNVDCLDIFQLNKPSWKDLEDRKIFFLLDSLKRSGKIRYGGIVVRDIETGFMSIKSGSVDCLQILYNLLYFHTESLIAEASQNDIGVIVRSPLNSGLLSGTYTLKTVFPPDDERCQYFAGESFAARLGALHEIQRALRVDNNDLLEFSLRFILSNPHVSVVIPGASSVSQVERYVQCSGKERFSDADLERTREVVCFSTKSISPVFQN